MMELSKPSRAIHDQRGSVMIETGLIVVLLFGLIFLVMDLSMLIFIKSTLQQAVREGVRVGSTGRLIGSTQYLNDSIAHAVQGNSLGFLGAQEGFCKIQVRYFNPDTGAVSTGTQGDLLVVSVNRFNYTPLGAVLKRSDPLAISVSASDIVERCPVNGCPTTQNPEPPSCP
jgi:Flp pilus assembly protein TadG